MINIDFVKKIDEAKKCDELLTKLIQSEKRFNDNINKNYIVNNWFEKVYNEKNNIIFIAKDNNKIVGYIYCKIDSIEDGPTSNLEALIDGLYVEKEYRNQGIATKLINFAINWAKEKNVKNIYLNVLEKNKDAINLYYKKGFKNFERKLKFEIE